MNGRKKVAFYTLGCKLNFSETSTIARSFEHEEFDRVDFSQPADVYVINTCSVTKLGRYPIKLQSKGTLLPRQSPCGY